MKVLVCGDREWSDREAISEVLRGIPRNSTVIHGAARGADSLAGEVAQELGHEVVAVPAEWDRYGRGAGPKRNLAMLDMDPELVIAFHHDLSKSRGTAHTVREATKRGIKIEVYG